MAGDPIAMPLRGSRDAPKFDGRTPAHLPCFFEDIEILGEAAQILEEAQIKAAIRYADLDEAEVWLTLTAASGRNWDAFVAAVKDLYPGCEGGNRYCRADLQYLVQDYCSKPMRSQDDLGEYRRRFLKISAPLIANKKLADTERDTFFLDGFPRAVANWVRHRLSIIRADLHPDNTYPIEDVIEAAKFLLTGAALRELLARPDDRGRGALPAPHQPSGSVVKQEYTLQTQRVMPRSLGCAFCVDPSHYIRDCPHVDAYLKAGILTIACPEGEVELEIEPSAFLSMVDDPEQSMSPYSTDPDFQPYFAQAWASYQADRSAKDRPRRKWVQFNGVEVPAHPSGLGNLCAATVADEIVSPEVQEARENTVKVPSRPSTPPRYCNCYHTSITN
ncbi:hypothetical protein PAXRUDRAFT_17860 [Paxillus rubicundulus Ve08.2h10]|uniref:CCHC-type domain-containing protein n=1 Tax=Paxillus rubicundulus Ve08.2h10 TaxID=930991 RepID=A0A0D0D068_9AGAM|nr:hypothetical protein PAXRUDRAFT_17860 [Paxillus rubicundulus Ve08.2h10]